MAFQDRQKTGQRIRIYRGGHNQPPPVCQHDLQLDIFRRGLSRRIGRFKGKSKRHERWHRLPAELAVPILSPPNREERPRDPMPSRRCCDLTVSQIAFLHDPDLVRIAPGAPPRNITGGQDLNLGCELKVGHKVGLSTEASPASDGPRRRRTLKRPEFVIVDGAPGLEAALVGLWSEDLPIQRCTVHKHRSLLAHAPKHMQDELT